MSPNLAKIAAKDLHFVEGERGDMDQPAPHWAGLRPATGDDRATIGMADQAHWAIDLVDVARDVLGVVRRVQAAPRAAIRTRAARSPGSP